MSFSAALVISCPNGGGLFLRYNGSLYRIFDQGVTGFDFNDEIFFFGAQPDSVVGLSLISDETIYEAGTFPDVHDVFIRSDGEIYVVSTKDNAIKRVDLDNQSSIDELLLGGEPDSRHVNCLCQIDGVMYYSEFGDFEREREYKGRSFKAGSLLKIDGGPWLTQLSQPHSPTWVGEELLLADSECKALVAYGPTGLEIRRKVFEGYTRGICVTEGWIFVGLSCSRNIDDNELTVATVVQLDKASWVEVDRFELPVKEIYGIKAVQDETLLYRLASAFASRSEQEYEGSAGSLIALAAITRNVLPKLIADLQRGVVELSAVRQRLGRMEIATEESNEAMVNLEREVLNLNAELTEASKREESLAAQLTEASQREERLGEQLTEASQREESLAAQLNESVDLIARGQQEISALKDTISVVSGELLELKRSPLYRIWSLVSGRSSKFGGVS